MTKLIVTCDPSPTPIVVRNAGLSVVGQGPSPLELQVEPGLYMATAIRTAADDINELVLIPDADERKVHLAADSPSIVQRAISGLTRIVSSPTPPTPSLTSPQPPAQQEIEPPTDFRIRFVRLKGWTEWEVVNLTIIGYRYRRGKAEVDIAIPEKGTIFAQVELDFDGPLNVELTPAALLTITRCQLVVTPTKKSIKAHVELPSDAVDAAAEYLSRGYVSAAKNELHKVETAEANKSQEPSSFLSNAFSGALDFLRRRTTDPAAVLLERYVQLRSGDSSDIGDTFHQFADDLQELPDGYIISAERLARKGKHREALDLFLKLENAKLPLFTEGFSLLITRLRQYSQQRFATSEIDDEGAKRAHDLLDRLYTWAPYIDLKCRTLTFPGADPTEPSEEKGPSKETDGAWQSIIPNSVFVD